MTDDIGYAGLMSSDAPAEGPIEVLERELTVAKLALFARRAPVNAAATIANAVLLCALLYPTASHLQLQVWGALQLTGAFWFGYRTRRPRRPPRGSRRGLLRATLFCTFAGLSLGSVVLMVAGASDVGHVLVFVTLAAMASAASTTLASIPQAAYGYIAGALLVPAVFWLLHGNREYVILALLAVSMTSFLVFNARITYEGFLEGLARGRQVERLRARFHAEQAEWLDLSQGTEAFALLDANGDLLLWNQRFEQAVAPGSVQRGRPYRELLARCARPPLTVDGATVSQAQWLELRCDWEHPETELLEQYPDGVFYRVSTRRLASGRHAVLAVNVTALKRTERALHEGELALLRAQRHESVGVIAGGVAHDFNNLLTAVGGAAELLAAEVESGEGQELLGDIIASVERGSRLTRQLLAYGRKQPRNPRPLDWNEVLTRQLPLFRLLLPATIQLDARLDPELWSIEADPEQLEQVVMNLVLNARDAMPLGGELRLCTRNVAPDRVELSVQDNGVGMEPETAERAFEPFFSTKQQHLGSGLGLSAVQGIVRQSGGNVSLHSSPQQGTRVTVLLPRCEASAGPSSSRQRSSLQPLPDRLETRVLLVDDDELVLATTASLLQRLGYGVLTANGPRAALELLTRERGAFSLLVTDVVMPDMNGAELARAARELVPELKVLFISGYDAGFLEPFDAPNVLQKPFSREQLEQAVAKALASPRSRAARRAPGA
ncbi:MAG TPA: ATP-binding protein [Polyangiaceae bacterium]|nr:ATP-binding protein [Polyangiaceae bacterium]